MALKDYKIEQDKIANKKLFAPSGVKSPKSAREMQVVLPLEKHPELIGLVRAVDIHPTDPKQNWKGWVPYTTPKSPTPLPTPTPTPTPEEIALDAFHQNVKKLKRFKKAIDLGIKKDNDPDVVQLISTLKTNYKEEYLELLDELN